MILQNGDSHARARVTPQDSGDRLENISVDYKPTKPTEIMTRVSRERKRFQFWMDM